MQALRQFSQSTQQQPLEAGRCSLLTCNVINSSRPTPRRSVRPGASAAEVAEAKSATSSRDGVSRAALKASFTVAEFEQIEETPAEVTGRIPEWLRGSLVLNGCGDYTAMAHMFDGFALLHKYRICEEGIFTSHRFLQTEAYKGFKATGRLKWREFYAAPKGNNLLENLIKYTSAAIFGGDATTDNASVALVPCGDKMLAVSEPTTAMYEVDIDTLTLGKKFTPDIPGDITTAHPLITKEGDLVNVASDLVSKYTVYRLKSSTMECEEIASIPLRTPFSAAWIHDFPSTDNYVAIVENPCTFDMPAIMSGAQSEYGMLQWNPEECSYIHLVPIRNKGKVRTFRCPRLFNFHFGNAFESDDGKKFCFDAAMHRDPKILRDISLEVLMDAELDGQNDVSEGMLCRFEVPLDSDGGFVEWKPLVAPELHGKYCDFPTVNSQFRGKEHRYVYMTGMARPSSLSNCLVKVDVQEGTCKVWDHGYVAGEPNFVQAPNPTSEDDGVVIASVMGPDGANSLVILDAKSWEQVAIAKLPYGVPYRFHGRFFPET